MSLSGGHGQSCRSCAQIWEKWVCSLGQNQEPGANLRLHMGCSPQSSHPRLYLGDGLGGKWLCCPWWSRLAWSVCTQTTLPTHPTLNHNLAPGSCFQPSDQTLSPPWSRLVHWLPQAPRTALHLFFLICSSQPHSRERFFWKCRSSSHTSAWKAFFYPEDKLLTHH
jgi:hypothetical protein